MKHLIIILALLFSLWSDAAPRGRTHIPSVATSDTSNPWLRTEIVTADTLRQGEKALQLGEKRAIVHGRPIWYHGDQDAITEIDTDVEMATEDSRSVWKSDRNTIKFRVRDDGMAIYRVHQHVLRARPSRRGVEKTDGSEARGDDSTDPTSTAVDGSKITQLGQFADLRFEHEVLGGSIKETAWLDSKPTGLAGNRWYRIAWDWTSATLTPTIIRGDIHWRVNNRTIIRWPAPIVMDDEGEELRAQYRLLTGKVMLLVRAADLRTAAYPVGIDPTSTTDQTDATVALSLCESGSSSSADFESSYFQITLPDMTGNTVSAAEFQVYTSLSSDTVTFDVYAASTAAFITTTDHSVLEAFAMGTVLHEDLVSADTTGWNYADITGDASSGVIEFYDDDITGGLITVLMDWVPFAATVSNERTSIRLGPSGGDQRYASQTDATNYPRIEITYTAGGGGPSGTDLARGFFF